MGGGGGGGGGGRGACCSQKSPKGGVGEYESSKLDQILVRFRPIAPKPALSGTVFNPENSNSVFLTKARAKRRYVRHNNKKSTSTKTNSGVVPEEKGSGSEQQQQQQGGEMVTLSLLPETPGAVRASPPSPSVSDPTDIPRLRTISAYYMSDRTVAPVMQQQQQQQKGSIVLVEYCVEGPSLVNNNDDSKRRMMDLENDTCPGFVSDGYDRVWWTNEAYKRMVGGSSTTTTTSTSTSTSTGDDEGKMVWLVMKEKFPLTTTAFMCRVRLQYTCRRENTRKSMIVPCDVWRMHGGNFAWRLDVQAALSLGR